ncbi:MAG: DUF4233 domain-containing protein [Stackebrandtia sp.]
MNDDRSAPEVPDDVVGDATEDSAGDAAGDSAGQSGLRDPRRAMAAMGAIVLALESLVLLLTIVPMRMMRIEYLDVAIGIVLTLTLAAIVFAARARHTWAWHGGTAIQLILLASGYLHWSLAAVGLIFGLTWAYAWSVRRKLDQPPVRE